MLRESEEYSNFTQEFVLEVNPVITNITGIELASYSEGLELCHFLQNAWLDGHSFHNFSYE
jgi:hypothetical protein